MNKPKNLCIAMPTKLQIHANTVLSLMNSFAGLSEYNVKVEFLPGKSNIDQSRSILTTNWYDQAGDDDVFLFIDSDQTFTAEDIKAVIDLDSDLGIGVYGSLAGYPTCRPKNYQKFLTGESNELYYGATGFMRITKPILKKVEEFIKRENMGHSRFYISPQSPSVIPFFKQRLIISEPLTVISLNRNGLAKIMDSAGWLDKLVELSSVILVKTLCMKFLS